MPRLFIEKSIDINAPAAKIWQVLTDPGFTNHWVPEFGMDGNIESDWKVGSPVLWKDASGKVRVEGKVIALEPGRHIHFSVVDAEWGPPPGMDDSDGITYEFIEQKGRTIFSISQMDLACRRKVS